MTGMTLILSTFVFFLVDLILSVMIMGTIKKGIIFLIIISSVSSTIAMLIYLFIIVNVK